MPAVPGPPVIVTHTPFAGPEPVWRLSANVTLVVLPVLLKWSSGTVSVTHDQRYAMSLGHGCLTGGAVVPEGVAGAVGAVGAVGARGCAPRTPTGAMERT